MLCSISYNQPYLEFFVPSLCINAPVWILVGSLVVKLFSRYVPRMVFAWEAISGVPVPIAELNSSDQTTC